jgi:hypothetical protein
MNGCHSKLCKELRKHRVRNKTINQSLCDCMDIGRIQRESKNASNKVPYTITEGD